MISNISTKFRNVTTSLNIPFDVAKSALQKYIRRGLVVKAQYVACDLDMFKQVPSQSIITNIYNRLRIITLEDIGIGCPEILPRIDSYLDNWLKQSDPKSISLLTAVRELCLCPHSRFYSHIRAYTKSMKPPESNIPNLKFPTQHSLQYFVDNLIWSLENKNIYVWYWAQQILNVEKLDLKYFNSNRPGFLIFAILEKLKISPETTQICKKWYKTLKCKEQFLCIIHPIYTHIFNSPNFSFPGNIQTLSPYDRYHRLVIDDYIYDMHTKQGRIQNKNSADFAIEGSLVTYEKVFNSKLASYYIKTKVESGTCSFETDEFKLKCRAQLICSKSRPDTYFATNKLNQNVVVKGPYLLPEQAIQIFNIQSVLKLFPNINYINTNIKLVIPDMFNGVNNPKTPLGCRTQIKPDYAYCFVVMEDLMNITDIPVKIKSSKLWPETQVADYETIFKQNNIGFAVPSEMSEKAILSLLFQLIIRYVFKIGDFASRNFIRICDKVYNLDTENINVSNTINFSKKETEILQKSLNKNKEDIIKVLNNWLEIPTIWDLVYVTFGEKDSFQSEIKKIISNPFLIFVN
jgi:hypothetical protein